MSNAEEEVDYGDYEQDYAQGGEYEGEYGGNGDNGDAEAEADADDMLRRMKEMDDELETLGKASEKIDDKLTSASENLDECSIYIGQVDYEATAEELRAHFSSCGTINRVTIMTTPAGVAKGFAYIEFATKECVDKALTLDDTPFKGRQLKVVPKRQNISKFDRGGGEGAAGGRFGGRGGGRGGRGGRGFESGFGGRGGRGRGRGGYRGGFRGGGGGRFPARGRGGRAAWNAASSPY